MSELNDVNVSKISNMELPGEMKEMSCEKSPPESDADTKIEGIDFTSTPKTIKDGSLFELTGVDFVAEGKYVFGRPEEHSWKPKSLTNLKKVSINNVTKSLSSTDRALADKENGDGLQTVVTGIQHDTSETEIESKEDALCEMDDKPIVRKQFKNFKLNEKILSQISSERSNLYELERERAVNDSAGELEHQIVFNDTRSRVYTLTFNRKVSDTLKHSRSDAFKKFQYKNSYRLCSETQSSSIYDEKDNDILLNRAPDETFRTHSVAKLSEEPPTLKVYKTHSDLTIDDLSMKAYVMEKSSQSEPQSGDESLNVTSDIDENIEDEIKIVEPITSFSSVEESANLQSNVPPCGAIIEFESQDDFMTEKNSHYEGNTPCVSQASFNKISSKKPKVSVTSLTQKQKTSEKPAEQEDKPPVIIPRRSPHDTSTMKRKAPIVAARRQGNPPYNHQMEGKPKSPKKINIARFNISKFLENDQKSNAESFASCDQSSFISINLEPDLNCERSRKSQSAGVGDTGSASELTQASSNLDSLKMGSQLSDVKKNKSRMLKIKRRVKDICEKVKLNMKKK